MVCLKKNKSQARISIFNEQHLMGVFVSHSFPFPSFGMNLRLSSDIALKPFLFFFYIGEHFNMAICPFWGINLFLKASTSSKYSCDNPSPSEDPTVKKKHTLQNFKTWKSNVYIHTFEFWMKTFKSEIKVLSTLN